VGIFVLVWFAAFLSVALLGEIRIIAESAFTGTPRVQIVAVQNASSGMGVSPKAWRPWRWWFSST
jgi:hypothetical protein